MSLSKKRVVVTGGTGTLGRAIVSHLLIRESPESVTVFSRDEAKQGQMRSEFMSYDNLRFTLGDVRDYQSVRTALRHADIVIHAAALKQVPACERFPAEAIRTNVGGAQNIVQAISDERLPVECVVGISTDKACYPSCVYGNTKALQEQIFIEANVDCPETRFVSVRLGNLIGSRGSVALIFREQVASGGPVTITEPNMTRFWFGVNEAVAVVMTAVSERGGDIVVPRIQATTVDALARAFIDARPIRTRIIGIRPGEKMHEALISQEEARRAEEVNGHMVLHPALSELCPRQMCGIPEAYTSDAHLMSDEELSDLLGRYGLL